MSDASVKRAGGVVSCAFGSRFSSRTRVASRAMRSPTVSVGQHRFLLLELGGRIVAALDVRAAEAGELDRLARRGEDRRLALVRVGGDFHRRPQHARVDHLRRHRALPDQLVDAEVVAGEHAFERRGRAREVRRPNRFVRFLRVLDLRRVPARRGVVLVAEQLADRARRFRERFVAQRRRVGAVVGDVAVLKQPLRGLHRPLRGEPELAARFLRERRRRERRGGALDARLRVDRGDRPRQVADRARRRARRRRLVREQPDVLRRSARRWRRSPCRWRRARRRCARACRRTSRPSAENCASRSE